MDTAQVMKALGRANEVKRERYLLKCQVGAGELPVSELILKPPACLNSRTPVSIAELLSWQNRWGLKRAETFLRNRPHLRMRPDMELRALSVTRRRQLARAVRGV